MVMRDGIDELMSGQQTRDGVTSDHRSSEVQVHLHK